MNGKMEVTTLNLIRTLIWTDVNGNNKFDAVWMAGFQNKRAAQGVKDDLMAVTAVTMMARLG